MDTNLNIRGYKIIRRIGKGGCGTVYLVQKENKYYALKKITDLTKEEIKEYEKILNSLFKLNNEYVIKYYESFLENSCLYIIMEYGGDSDLKRFIKNYKDKNQLIEEKIIKDIINQICLGIKEIHKNKIIHRDLTPDNIFINNNYKIKIGDFSVSKILTKTKNLAKTQVGKQHYFAPEIERGEEYNNKIDIYSLGCIIYELLTLNEYYIDVIYNNKDGKIDLRIYDIIWQNLINKCVQKDYNKRPTIDEIYENIKENKKENKNENKKENEIICTYHKKNENPIYLLHNYYYSMIGDEKIKYDEAKNEISGENIEIYIDNKKSNFNPIYDGKKIGFIKVKFKINKLLISTSYMFYDCKTLETIDLSSLNTNNVTDMNNMFYGCESLKSINLSSFNTNNVTNMSEMFSYCSSLKLIDLSSFNTNKVTNMSCMFFFCSSLESIDLSLFNTNNLTKMGSMFYQCSSLKSIDLSSFNTNNVTDMNDIFSECSSLKSINLSSFNTNNVTSMHCLFNNCSLLESLDLSTFNTKKVTDMNGIFSGCSSLKSIDLTLFNTNNVVDMSGMFSGCSSLKSIDLSLFDTSKVQYMFEMFYKCSSLKSIDLSSFNTNNTIVMRNMFSLCSSLKSLDLSSFHTNNVKDVTDMFKGCFSLKKDNIKINKNSDKILNENSFNELDEGCLIY